MSNSVDHEARGILPNGGTYYQFLRTNTKTGRITRNIRQYRFSNGYGASVVETSYAGPGDSGLWELAVMECDPKNNSDWGITYETPVTDDVIANITIREVNLLLQDIQNLPPREGFRPSRDESHETQRKIPPITAEDIEALRRSY